MLQEREGELVLDDCGYVRSAALASVAGICVFWGFSESDIRIFPMAGELWFQIALATLIVFVASCRTYWVFDTDSKDAYRKQVILFLIPLTIQTISFSEVRYIDFSHNKVTARGYALDWMVHRWAADHPAYEAHLVLKNRKRVHLATDRKREALAEASATIARRIGVRLG